MALWPIHDLSSPSFKTRAIQAKRTGTFRSSIISCSVQHCRRTPVLLQYTFNQPHSHVFCQHSVYVTQAIYRHLRLHDALRNGKKQPLRWSSKRSPTPLLPYHHHTPYEHHSTLLLETLNLGNFSMNCTQQVVFNRYCRRSNTLLDSNHENVFCLALKNTSITAV